LRASPSHWILLAASVCLGFWFAPALSAQSASKAPGPPDYSKQSYVYENIVSKVSFQNDGTGSRDTIARARIQTQAGAQKFGILNVPYPSGTATLEIVSVHVIKPDKRVVETPAENQLEMPLDITRQAPFYSDLKEKQIAVKGLEVGDEVEYEYRITTTTALAPGQFWFAYDFYKDGICLNEELQIAVPAKRQIKLESPAAQPTVSEKDGSRIYVWKTSNLEVADNKKVAKKAAADETPNASVQLSSFQSWDEVGQWFSGLVAPRAVPTPQVQAKADEITKNLQTDDQKIRALYNYVSTKFRYIGISLGIGRYQPHAAEDVLSNDYGDCKDKHTLFTALLAAEKIRAYPALMNSSAKIDPDMPSPAQFDHVITAIPKADGYLFLDTTPEVAPFGMLIAALRDKDALVIPDSGVAKLVRTPAEPPFKSQFLFNADGALGDDGTLVSKMQITLRGDAEVFYRRAFREAGQPQYDQVMQQISSLLGFGGTVSDTVITPPDATSTPFHVEYTYTRKKYADWENRRILSPFPYLFLPAVPDEMDDKSKPIDLGAPTEFSLVGTMKLPPNSDPSSSSPVDLHEDFADFHSSRSYANGALHFERRLITKTLKVPPGEIAKYETFTKTIDDTEGTYIPLRAEDDVPSDDSENPEALEFFAKGNQAWQMRDFPSAADSMARAVEKDPKFTRAWLALGTLHIGMNQPDLGIEEMKKAIALDPKRAAPYVYLATSLTAMRREDEALTIWKQLQKELPDNTQAPLAIAEILMRKKQYSEALPGLEAAANERPEDTQLQLTLGEAYLHTGKKDKGLEALRAAASNDNLRNDVAYVLADNGIELKDALRYSQDAVSDAEDATTSINLDDVKLADLQTPLALSADWDTLGWVHFRMGEFDAAEKYLNAAWHLTQDAVIGDHLGQVYEKQGKRRLAIAAYADSLTAGHAPEETRARLDALEARGKQDTSFSNAVSLQSLRMSAVPKFPAKPREHASAEFFVLIGPGPKVVGVKFISGSEELKDAGKVLATAKFDALFPDDNDVLILRRGVLDCEPELPGCQFVVFPPNSVRSVR
jgi:tetratricopeptide (TPR) repeat protein